MRDSTKVPFYILGFLLRSGPLHGYQLKLQLEREASDFAKIKMANLYYHLDILHSKGWILSKTEEDEKRPDRKVYRVTTDGEKAFTKLADDYLASKTVFDFPLDGALFFIGQISPVLVEEAFERNLSDISESLEGLASHKAEALSDLREPYRSVAELIFTHHQLHYEAECAWLKKAKDLFAQPRISKLLSKEASHGKA